MRMKKALKITGVHVSFLLGVWLSCMLVAGSLSLMGAMFVVLLLWVFCWFMRWDKIVLMLWILMLIVGSLRFFWALPRDGVDVLAHYNDLPDAVTVQGCIEEALDLRRDHLKFTLEVFNVKLGNAWMPVKGAVLVKAEKYLQVQYGDCLELTGKMLSPTPIENFSYDNYLARFGIYSVMYDPFVRSLDLKKRNLMFGGLLSLKEVFESKLNDNLHEPYSSFAAGLLTGSRKGIPEDVLADFNVVGLTHIVAISGYNITLLIVLISQMFAFLSKRLRFWICAIVIVLFTIFVGASAAVVRASIMGIISLMALQSGRKGLVMLVLFSSAFLMNMFNPYMLVYDAGFQLSFAATLGLIVFADRIKNFFKFLPDFYQIKDSFTMTMAAQVFTLPILVFGFGRLSLITPLANIAVAPLLPLAMFFGFFSAVFSFFSNWLHVPFSFMAWFFLDLIVKIAHFFAEVPYASIEI